MAATTPARKTTGSGIRKTSFPSYKHITQSYITTITGESPTASPPLCGSPTNIYRRSEVTASMILLPRSAPAMKTSPISTRAGTAGRTKNIKKSPFRFQTQNERHYTPPCDVSHFWGRIIFITLPHTVNHFLGVYNIH